MRGLEYETCITNGVDIIVLLASHSRDKDIISEVHACILGVEDT